MAIPIDIPTAAPRVLTFFEQTHVNAEIEPSGAKHLTYRVAVPKTWPFSSNFGPTPTGMLEIRGLGFFASANLPTAPLVATTATNIPYEVPIDAWARIVFAHEGYEILAARWFPGPTGLFYDITGVRTVDEVLEVRRSAVRVKGNEIICLNCMCSREHWDAAKEVFWVAMITFELADAKPTRMEPWLRAAADHPAFELAHPASWLAEPVESAPPGVSALDVKLAGEEEKLLGYLQVRAELLVDGSMPTLKQLDASALARLKNSGFVPSEEKDPRALSVKGWLGGFSGDGSLMGADITSQRGFVEREGIVYSFAMLSPRKANNPLVALRTLRVFEIARATLNPLSKR
jgi:hypothetical protein